ncbi:DNA methyltransferase [Citrobacter phage HCF1]|uniref:Site-specific DNA-cytosine methylase n=1 Tax=Citrobacter phage HCF1 TaxID=2849700 RepID=A0ABX6D8S9_9CAUD|nr:DNA methyltransferase [Citrobacter phage HCF1]
MLQTYSPDGKLAINPDIDILNVGMSYAHLAIVAVIRVVIVEADHICFNYDDADHGDYSKVRVTHPNIEYVNVWIDGKFTVRAISLEWGKPDFIIAFPPCTDTAVSGSRHFAAKRDRDPEFQIKAMETARIAQELGDWFNVPYMIENPISVLSTMWRQPDYIFHPCGFGGYLPEDDKHPHFPDIIPARDAYTKKTCLWTGNGFVMPDIKSVLPTGNANRLAKARRQV